MTAWRRTLHAEWTKLVSVRSSPWLLVGIVVMTAGLGAAVNGTLQVRTCGSGEQGCAVDTTRYALLGTYLGQIPALLFGALVATSDYASGTMRTTLLAMPRRFGVYSAKVLVVLGPVVAAAVLAVVGSVVVSRAIQSAHGFTAQHGYQPLSLADGPTLRAAVGTVCYLGLLALLGLGAAMALRDTAATLTTALVLLLGFPILVALVNDPDWRDALYVLSPMSAGLTVQMTRGLDAVPLGPWEGLGVVAAYALTALLAGAALFRLRDA